MKISIVATGDSFITQRLLHDIHFTKLKSHIEADDVQFTNVEILLHDFEVYPAPSSWGYMGSCTTGGFAGYQATGF